MGGFLIQISDPTVPLHISMAHSKRYNELKKLADPKKVFSIQDGVELAKKTANTKFDSTIEIHFNLGIDVRKGDQQVRSTIVFPHAVGKPKRVAAFVSSAKEQEAKEAGADLIGAEELIDEIAKSGKINFDVAVATPDMMVKLSKVAKILGPAGLMPNPKTDTVGPNVKKMVEEIKKGKVAFKNDSQGNIHQAIGKASMDANKIIENLNILLESIKKAKPASSKGVYLKSVTLASTMGPAVKLDTSKLA